MTDAAKSAPLRPTDIALAADPADAPGDARLVFIGRIHSAWSAGGDTPRNPTEARERQGGGVIQIDPPYRAGLRGLENYSHVFVLVWLDQSRRDIIVHQPKHFNEPRGVFSMRSPLRPNPIGLSAAKLISVDEQRGIVTLDAIDFRDGTPVIDLKPYRPGIDAIPDALVG